MQRSDVRGDVVNQIVQYAFAHDQLFFAHNVDCFEEALLRIAVKPEQGSLSNSLPWLIIEMVRKNPTFEMPNTPDSPNTQLLLATKSEQKPMVEFLLKQKYIDVNVRDMTGLSPLAIAAKCGRAGIVKLLLQHKDIDVNARDSTGRTPMDWAKEGRHNFSVILLRQYENKTGPFEETP